MTILVIAEHDNATLKDATHKTVTAAAAISTPVHVLVAGENCAAVAEAAAKIAGVEKVLLADAPAYARQLAEPMEALILSLAGSYDAILAPATTTGKNILPRVAAKLDMPQISEILKVISPDTFERPIYAGNAIETLQAPAGKKVITVRTTAFAGGGGRRQRRDREDRRRRRSRHFQIRRRSPVQVRAPGTDLGQDRDLRRARAGIGGEFQAAGFHRRQAACGGRRQPRRGGCGLCAQRLSGRPDRQGGGARSLHRGGHFRRHPASGRHEGFAA